MNTTRPSLLSRVRDPGDNAAWTEFDARYHDLILRYCSRRGLQLADAEDIRQTVMIGLSKALRNFRYEPRLGRFRDYLGRAVRNAIHTHARRADRGREASIDNVEPIEVPPEVEAEWEDEWVLHHFRLATAKLRRSFEKRSLDVFQDLLDGSSVEEVSQKHGVSAERIYKIKQRVKTRLQEEIEAQVREDEFPERSA